MSNVSLNSADLYCNRFQPLQLLDSSETPDFVLVISQNVWYSNIFSKEFNITFQIIWQLWYFSALTSNQICIWGSNLQKVLHCFLPTMVWQMLMFTDWPLTSSCLDQEEIWGHAESWPLLSAHWTPDAPLQPVHHDNLQRAVRGLHTYTLQACAHGTVMISHTIMTVLAIFILLQLLLF